MRAGWKTQIASRPAASMPAATASRRMEYSASEIDGNDPLPDPPPCVGRGVFLVRGKLSHRLGDLVWVGHEELLLWSVERHGRDVRRRDPDHRAVEVAEGVLRYDGRDLGAKTPGQVVLVHDHSLAGLADRFQDRVPVERRHRAEVDHLDAHSVRLQLRRRLYAVAGHEPPREA